MPATTTPLPAPSTTGTLAPATVPSGQAPWMPGQNGTNSGGTGVTNSSTASSPIGEWNGSPNNSSSAVTAPITNSQLASAYQMDPTQAANIATNINGGYNLQNSQNFANSPLAGLTTLGGAAQINNGQSNNILGGQLQNINQLQQMANGQGPNPAAIAAQQTGQQNVSNEMAMLGSQRGSGNTALGLRSAGNAIANANQQAVQASVAGQAQQQMQAEQALTGALSGTQSQVMQGAQAQAGLNEQNVLQQGSMNQQTALANLGAEGSTQAMNANEYNAMLQAQMTQANNALTASENYGNTMVNQNLTEQGLAQGLAINNQNNNLALTSAGISGGATVGAGALQAFSDKRLKKNIKSANRSVQDFLSHIDMSSNKGFKLLGAAV